MPAETRPDSAKETASDVPAPARRESAAATPGRNGDEEPAVESEKQQKPAGRLLPWEPRPMTEPVPDADTERSDSQ